MCPRQLPGIVCPAALGSQLERASSSDEPLPRQPWPHLHQVLCRLLTWGLEPVLFKHLLVYTHLSLRRVKHNSSSCVKIEVSCFRMYSHAWTYRTHGQCMACHPHPGPAARCFSRGNSPTLLDLICSIRKQ